MRRLGEKIVTTHFPESIALSPEQAQVAGEGGRVAGHVEDVRDSQVDDLLKPLGAEARPRGVQDKEVKAREGLLFEDIFHPSLEESTAPDAVESGVFSGRADVRGL